MEFEKTFYRNLACGKTLLQAFEIARQEILVSPRIATEHRWEESQKFCLLPKNGVDHDVPIFFQRKYTPSHKKHYAPPNHFLPPPPDVFVGRELDQFRIIQAIRDSRLVRISGPKGVGKSSLVKACCQYLKDRLHIIDFTEIIWIAHSSNNHHHSGHNLERRGSADKTTKTLVTLMDHVHYVYQMVLEEEFVSPLYCGFLSRAADSISKIIDHLHFRRPILVIDARTVIEEESLSKLTLFVETIINVSATQLKCVGDVFSFRYRSPEPVCISFLSGNQICKGLCHSPPGVSDQTGEDIWRGTGHLRIRT